MELYLDTGNLEHIRSGMELGFLDGITTNPSILAKEKRAPMELLKEIDRLVPGKVWYQVTGRTAEDMIREAREAASLCKRPVIKFPMSMDSLQALHAISEDGIETNMTLVYTPAQAVLAAKAGAAYISPYLGRIDDVGASGLAFVREVREMYRTLGFETKIIAASIRGTQHVVDAAKNGVDAMTMSYDVFRNLAVHPLTEKGSKQFADDWEALLGESGTI